MPTYKNMDVCLPFLKQRLKEARTLRERDGIQIAINLIVALPQEHIEEGYLCEKCWFYNKDKKRCRHPNGLGGRVLPEMYCCFASPTESETPDILEDVDDFSEFDD